MSGNGLRTADDDTVTLDATMNPASWAHGGRLVGALSVAATLHANQVRKGTRIPYLSHLLGTCAIALEHGANEDQAIAALLHDALEDVQPLAVAVAAVDAFGPEVHRIVRACTDATEHPKPVWRARKERYLTHLAQQDHAVLLVSASDKLHNARTIVSDVHAHGQLLWERFNAPREDTVWYYNALVDAYASNADSVQSLVDELGRTVAEMSRLASAEGRSR